MELLHARCAGLDVHATNVVACVRVTATGAVTYEYRTVPTTTRGLLELADWLASHACTHLVLESTGVYWKPVWHILEGQFSLTLANAMHVRNVPGRKSDKNDATWLADLLAMGLIRGSFVPPASVQALRDLTRTRKQFVRELARHFGRRFVLIGDHFRRYGLPARASDYRNVEQIYWRSKVVALRWWEAGRCSLPARSRWRLTAASSNLRAVPTSRSAS